jgi:holliday junction resolvase Hjr
MSRKSKGTNSERELVHLLHRIPGWSAVRVAGSGSSKYPSPDIIAGNSLRYLAIECKSTRSNKKYLEKSEVDQLLTFAKTFGAEPWIAVRFLNEPWYFLKPEQLENTGNAMAVSKALAKNHCATIEKLSATKHL